MTTTRTRIEKALTLFEEESSRKQFLEQLKSYLTSDEVLSLLEEKIKDSTIGTHQVMTLLLESDLRENVFMWIKTQYEEFKD